MGKSTKKAMEYIVTIENNPKFCGKGAGGVQFANGKAVVTSERMANWFKEHNGYKVVAVEKTKEPEEPETPAE